MSSQSGSGPSMWWQLIAEPVILWRRTEHLEWSSSTYSISDLWASLKPVGDTSNTSGDKTLASLLDSSGDYKDASKNIKSNRVDETAPTRDLSKFSFQKPNEVLTKQDGNQVWVPALEERFWAKILKNVPCVKAQVVSLRVTGKCRVMNLNPVVNGNGENSTDKSRRIL